MYTEVDAKEAREDDVDLLEEGRLLALSRSAIYQQSAPILQPQGEAKILPGGRPCAPADLVNSRTAQALGILGRPLYHE